MFVLKLMLLTLPAMVVEANTTESCPPVAVPACDAALRDEIRSYQPVVNQIIHEIVYGRFKGDTFWSLLDFTDRFGARFAGFQALEDSIDFLVGEFERSGLENVRTEEVPIQQWVRRLDEAFLESPKIERLQILTMGGSIPTKRGGIRAQVVAVESFAELSRLPYEAVQGKIILLAPNWYSYKSVVEYRLRGAVEAAKKGAVAALLESITPFSIGTLHTGRLEYEDGVRKIPYAALTVEDADRLLRYYRKGKEVVVWMSVGSGPGIRTTSRNTMAELTGSVHQNRSMVVLSGHLDSWDVGEGAMDNGGGAFISWKALKYLKALGLRPKRTIRAMLWTGNEQGLVGARFHERANRAVESDLFNFFLESDSGTFDPVGLAFSGSPKAECIIREVLGMMKLLNATMIKTPNEEATDISRWAERGFPAASLLTRNEKYFWFHHTHGDSIVVEDEASLDKCVAVFAAVSYVIADLSVDLPKDVIRGV